MAKRGEVWKNVSSTTTQDIKLNCTVESLKAVADAVTRLQTRVDFLEQDMYMVLQEIYKNNVTDMNKEEEEEDEDIQYQPKKKQRIMAKNESPKKKNKDESSLLRE